MKAAAVIFSLSAGLLSAQADTPLRTLEDRYTAAELTGLKTDDRIGKLQTKLKHAPGDERLRALLAEAYLQKLRETMDPAYLRNAAAVVDGILSRNAESYLGLRLENEIDMQRHDFPKVAERARKLLERNPSDSGTAGVLGDALMEQGRYVEAGESYGRMLELAPGLASYSRVAYYRFVTGKTAEALSWMNQAVRASNGAIENQAWCWVEFGDLLMKTGRMSDAELAYKQALRQFPTYHRANAAEGRLRAALEDRSAAIDYFTKAQASVPLPEYAAALEALYRAAGDIEKAGRQAALVDTVDKLMRANGETMNRNLALIYADEGRKLDRALELVQAEFTVRRDVFTYDALAWVRYKRKEYDTAFEASKEALKMGTEDPMLYYHAALIELSLGQREAARAHLEKAVGLSPVFDFRYAPDAKRQMAGLRQ